MKKLSKSGSLAKQLKGTSSLSSTDKNGLKLPASNEIHTALLSRLTQPKSIAFGKESKEAAGLTMPSRSSSLSAFIGNTLSHGLSGSGSGLLSGSGLFNISGMGSIGSLVSGLVNLFGGDSSKPAPLPSFSLPGSQIQNVAVHGVTAATIRTSGTTDSTYAQLPDLHNSGRSLADQSQQIAQAVKTALLQSHSLTDVISEL